MRLRLILNPNSSLLILSKRRLKEANNDLYNARNLSLKLKIKKVVTARDSFKYIFILVVLLIGVCQFDFGFLNSHIKINYVLFKDIVDNRINNVVTITSISLVVVGFLINNIKEKNKDTYELLFEETKLYPIVYFILGVIIFLLLASFFRNAVLEINHYKLFNLLIIGMLLIILVIICIGYLFSKIILITNSAHLNDIFTKKLIDTVKQVMYQEKISQISKEIFSERFSNYGIILSTSYGARHPNQINLKVKKPKMISDIDMDGFERSIRNLSLTDIQANLDFLPISINDNIYPQPIVKTYNHKFS